MLIATMLYFYYLIPTAFANLKIRRLISGLFLLSVLLLVLSLLLPPSKSVYSSLVYIFKPIYLVSVPLALLHFYIAAKNGYKLAWIYFISLLPLALNAILHFLQIASLIGIFHNNYLWEFSVFFELFLYSLTMIYSFRITIDEKRNAELLLEQNKQQFVHKLYKMQDLERIRFARDLHDSIGQKLSVVKMYLSGNGSEKAITFLDEAINEVRIISHNLIPEELSLGINRAIHELSEKINLTNKTKVTVESIPASLNLSKEVELSIYRIIQEILNNMVKHAQAAKIEVRLEYQNKILTISVSDNGIGFDTKEIEHSSGIGWQNIFARVKVLSGQIDIKSKINVGTKIKITIPIS